MLYYMPPRRNIGDEIVLHGLQRQLGAGEVLRYGEPAPPTDTLCVCGTPWIWDRCHESEKYANLERVLAELPAARKVAYGIGSCFPQRHIFTGLALSMAEPLKRIWGQFERVVCRDRLAYHALRWAGVDAELGPCPSMSHGVPAQHGRGGRNIFVAYNPAREISAGIFDADFYSRWERLNQRLFAELEYPRVLCVEPHECEWSQRVLGMDAECVAEWPVDEILQTLARAGRIVTGRIHMGLPALACGKEVLFLGVDSRVMTAELCGGKVLWCDEWGQP